MQYDIKAKETRYGGINFRSRLEAKWAAFFDLIGWNWTYEPVDFRGWTPDFAIKGSSKPVYVEVKPIYDIEKKVTNKIDASDCNNEVLLVGAEGPFLYHGIPTVGWLRDAWFHDDNIPVDAWDQTVLGRWKQGEGQIGFCTLGGSYTDRITGEYDGSCGFDVDLEEVQAMWREAHNRTRFIVP